jgi:hypothetical protein
MVSTLTSTLINYLATPPTHYPRPNIASYPDCRKTYIAEAAAHGNAHTLFSRLQHLLESKERDDALIESLDNLLVECCTVGESRCTKARRPWWSRKVHKLRAWRRILQKLQSAFKNNRNLTIKFITNASTRALTSKHYRPPSRPPLWLSPTSDKTFTTANRIANNFVKPSKLNKYLSSAISATKTPLRSSTTSENVKQKMKLIECLKTLVEKVKKRA